MNPYANHEGPDTTSSLRLHLRAIVASDLAGELRGGGTTTGPQANNGSGFRMEGLEFKLIVNPRKLEHGFRMISAGIPFTLP